MIFAKQSQLEDGTDPTQSRPDLRSGKRGRRRGQVKEGLPFPETTHDRNESARADQAPSGAAVDLAGGAEALVRRLGAVVDAVDAGALARLGDELLHRLEEVHVQAGELVDVGELRIGSLGGEAIIAHELPDDGAVLLLDVGAVVLFPSAAAGEGHPVAATPIVEAVVDELRAVGGVEADEWHRQPLPHVMDGAADALLALPPDRFELHPRRGDVHGAEGAEVEALCRAATVGHQIDLAEPRTRIVPLGEGANGDLLPEPGAGARGRDTPGRVLGAGGRQQASERRAAGVAKALLDVGTEGEFTTLGEPREEVGHEGVEPMGADSAARLPEDLGGGGDLRAVLARAAAGPRRRPRPRRPAQQPNGRLAMNA